MKPSYLILYFTLILLLLKRAILLKPSTIAYHDIESEFDLKNPDRIDLEKYYEIFNYFFFPTTGKADQVLRFKKAKSSTTKIAIYNKWEEIQVDETGVFINAMIEHDLDSKEVIIKADQIESIGDSELFIVFYDLQNDYADKFTLVIENNSQFISTNNCYNLYRFYSEGEMSYFSLNGSKYRFIILNMAYFGENSPSLEIRESNNKGKLIKEYKDLKLHDVIEISGAITSYYFRFKAKEGVPTYEVYDLNFCFGFQQTNITEILGQFAYKRVFTYDRPFYFKFNLTSYNENEENIAMLNLNSADINTYDGFYCKYIQDEQTDDQLIPQFPTTEDQNECAVQKDEAIDTTYHLYFKHHNTKDSTLLLYVRIKGEIQATSGLSLIVPNRIKEIEDDYYDINLSITSPIYYKINPNTIENSAIVTTNTDLKMSIILGSLSSGKVPNKTAYQSQLYAINKKENNQTEQPVVYIKLDGGKQKTSFETYFVPQHIVFYNKEHRSESISILMNDCTDYIYYIGSFITPSNYLLSVDQTYGNGNMYYQQTYDLAHKIQDNLPTDKSQEVLDLVKVQGNVDVLKITCTIPRHVTINYLPQDKPIDQLTIGDSFTTIMTSNQELTYDITPTENTGLEAKIETVDSKVAVYIDGQMKTELNQSNMVYRQIITKNHKCSMRFKSTSATDSLFSLSLGSQELYPNTITQTTTTRDQHVLIELDKAKQFYSADISISSSDTSLSVCTVQGLYDRQYIPLPKSVCHSLTDKYTLNVINPYDKYVTTPNPYYIAINVNNKPISDIAIQITYESKEPATTVAESTIAIIDTNTLRLRTAKSIDRTKTLLYYTFVPCFNENMDYQILFNKQTLFKATKVTTISSGVTSNMYAEIDFQFTEGLGIFSYNYVTQAQYDEFKVLDSYRITISSKNNIIDMQFAPFVKNKLVKYDIYAVMTNDRAAVIDECLLDAMTPIDTITQTHTDDDTIKHQIRAKEPGNYQINILATTVDGITARKAYKATQITISVEPEPDEDKPANYMWLWILIGCIAGIAIIVFIVLLVQCIKGKPETKQDLADPFDGIIE